MSFPFFCFSTHLAQWLLSLQASSYLCKMEVNIIQSHDVQSILKDIQIIIKDNDKLFNSHTIVIFVFLFSVYVLKMQKHSHITNIYRHRFIRKLALHNQEVRMRNCPRLWIQKKKAGLQICYTISSIFSITSTKQSNQSAFSKMDVTQLQIKRKMVLYFL